MSDDSRVVVPMTYRKAHLPSFRHDAGRITIYAQVIRPHAIYLPLFRYNL